ncbi:hypothetical protein CFP65_6364 [Kitasatospora sp. MMS16-BH015]|uniref:hypothetical protein n=1 Tax=Kitasatospora sp. MMS16-BH015 TaxID=2018025 RepID=UPI000CA3C81D|nr:hypothetical protein [Kitasatospora sp. MMS16-BH015]AUG81020.1 hypothetical protein CFP65_6364 [Kitasatospora sp. MMS16-BH015]
MSSTAYEPVHPVHPGGYGASAEEPAAAPVFVDQSGQRGRMFRGLGWPVTVAGGLLAAAMAGSLIGVQSDAPAMGIPAQPTSAPTPSVTPAPALPVTPAAPSSAPPAPSASATPHGKSATTTPKSGTSSKPGTTTHRTAPAGQPTKHA